jgi:hypothetical protein
MANAFWDEYDLTVGGNVASYLPLGDSKGYTKRDDDIFAWVNIILSRNEPISAVEDSVLRRELKHSEQVKVFEKSDVYGYGARPDTNCDTHERGKDWCPYVRRVVEGLDALHRCCWDLHDKLPSFPKGRISVQV